MLFVLSFVGAALEQLDRTLSQVTLIRHAFCLEFVGAAKSAGLNSVSGDFDQACFLS